MHLRSYADTAGRMQRGWVGWENTYTGPRQHGGDTVQQRLSTFFGQLVCNIPILHVDLYGMEPILTKKELVKLTDFARNGDIWKVGGCH